MKKIFAILFAVILCVSLCACSPVEGNKNYENHTDLMIIDDFIVAKGEIEQYEI